MFRQLTHSLPGNSDFRLALQLLCDRPLPNPTRLLEVVVVPSRARSECCRQRPLGCGDIQTSRPQNPLPKNLRVDAQSFVGAACVTGDQSSQLGSRGPAAIESKAVRIGLACRVLRGRPLSAGKSLEQDDGPEGDNDFSLGELW
jgi:hypothetical protein